MMSDWEWTLKLYNNTVLHERRMPMLADVAARAGRIYCRTIPLLCTALLECTLVGSLSGSEDVDVRIYMNTVRLSRQRQHSGK